jgi:hypothetical protein
MSSSGLLRRVALTRATRRNIPVWDEIVSIVTFKEQIVQPLRDPYTPDVDSGIVKANTCLLLVSRAFLPVA